MFAQKGSNEVMGKWVCRLFGIALLGPVMVFGQSTSTQMLSVFDVDPTNNIDFDGLISVGPPVADIGNNFDPLTVDPTFTPSIISAQALHLVAPATKPVDLDGPGRILYAGQSDDVQGIYVGSGALPGVTGTDGLTRLKTDQPTPFEFKRGETLFIYYVTQPGLSDASFGELFGNGTRSVLTLLADKEIPSFTSEERIKKPAVPNRPKPQPRNTVQSAPKKKVYVSAPTYQKTPTYSAPKRKPQQATPESTKRPLLALFVKASQKTTASKTTTKSKPKPLFSGKNIAKLREAIQKNREKKHRPLLAALCKTSSKPRCFAKTPVRRSTCCSRRSSSRPLFSLRKRRSRS